MAMATTLLGENTVHTVGDLPAQGSPLRRTRSRAPTSRTSAPTRSAGSRVVLNIFPSIATGVCAASVRRFNEIAAGLENTTVVCVSVDLPFALAQLLRCRGDRERHRRLVVPEQLRHRLRRDDRPTACGVDCWRARSSCYDTDGTVLHGELVDAIGHEPDYDAAVAALG